MDEPDLHTWKKVATNEEANDLTERMRVPGGWLYRVSVFTTEWTVIVVFVPWP